ncbi:MAG: ABC transporter ATP-binding protein [Nitrospiraceae bacterium]|jgi:ABC-2 type transport system ATP-binding protein|nr:MAG: ABC transporter ATP-binding protein [Nitrospiraceae bacterium]
MIRSSTAVKVRGLTKKFNDFTAVDNIDLNIKKGEIFGFIGPNGAGKTTTIKMLCGLLLPTAGEGTVGGWDIMKDSEEIKKNIGYMSQKFSLYDDLTVEENIRFFSGIYGVANSRKKERLEWVLQMAELQDRRRAVTKTLPGGFKQRLALGCAILHEPPMIFLDEPTSGVDPLSRRNFWNLINEMSKAGITIFVTTHYMDEADYCNRLALIYRGRIIAEGTPNELKQKYMTRYVLEVETDHVVNAMEVLNKSGMDAAIFGSLLHVTADSMEKAVPLIRGVLEDAGIPAHRIERIVPSLEDVFVNLIEVS